VAGDDTANALRHEVPPAFSPTVARYVSGLQRSPENGPDVRQEELAFQQEVRDWLKDNCTPEMLGELKVVRNAYLPKEKLIDWAEAGWRRRAGCAPAGPRNSAGRASPRRRNISSRWRWRRRARPAPRRSGPRCARR
jgi:hypothetical protein